MKTAVSGEDAEGHLVDACSRCALSRMLAPYADTAGCLDTAVNTPD
jgi:hypothetical protein